MIDIILQTRELIEDLKSAGGIKKQGGKIKLKLIPNSIKKIMRSNTKYSVFCIELTECTTKGTSKIFILMLALCEYPLLPIFHFLSELFKLGIGPPLVWVYK